MIPFVSLHDHGEYSLLDGAGTAVQHVEAAKAAGYLGLAITDHATLAGTLHHMRACHEGGIMPLVGVELYYRPNRLVQGQKEWLKIYYHLTIVAKDIRGWKSLMALTSESHRSGFYGRACADLELLERYSEGLICMTGCAGSLLNKTIVKEDDRGAVAWLRQLQRIYKDDLVVEIMPHDYDDLRTTNVEDVRLADQLGLPYVATIDAHYPTQDWAPVQDALLMIATNQTIKKREKKRDEGEDVYQFLRDTFYHQTVEEIRANFAEHHPRLGARVVDEAINNTLAVASKVVPFYVSREDKSPPVYFDDAESNPDKLRRLCYEALERKGYASDRQYIDRVEHELEVIEELGHTDYMLDVWQIVDWARSDRPVPKRKSGGKLIYEGKKVPIMVGPGRGSAAGSAVSWLLGLTLANPIKHNMLFERFLNRARKGKPDIDVDFPPDRVDEVEDFVKAVRGKDNVVDIIAHSTFGPRACITDVGRVLSIPYDHVKHVTKTIDEKDRSPLEELAVVNPEVRKFRDQYPGPWEIMTLIQGQVARKSEHAGGILVLPDRDAAGNKTTVADFIPVERQGGQKGKLLSAFGERSGRGNALISDYGYSKFDILRIAELTKQAYACELIARRTGEVVDLDALPVLDDPYAVDGRVMDIFRDGYFVGVFQWTGVAQKLTRQIKPDDLFDLAAINALIRPGPRGAAIDAKYARRKSGQEEAVAWHEVLEPYLGYTQNLMVFQEQLVQVVHALGGLSLEEADNFRKIASKLYRDPAYARETMGLWYEPIREGFLSKGIRPDEFGEPTRDDKPATGIWKEFLSFSDYSFNLSHADAYAILAYRDAHLKAYYDRELYSSFLSKGLSQVTKKRAVQKQDTAREVRHRGLKILPPDVNESGDDYTVVEGGIRFGLQSVKGIGPSFAAMITEHRPFSSHEDFERRMPTRFPVNARAALVMSGAFDRWRMRDGFTEERIDELERELLGMSLTSVYSIAQYAPVIDGRFWTEDEVDEAPDGAMLSVAGEVAKLKEHVDSKGGVMAFVDLAYGPNLYNLTIFSHLYAEYGELLRSRRPVLVTGEKSTYNGKQSIKVKTLPADDDGEATPPIMDFQDYVNLLGDQEELLATDSVFPEDQQEQMEQTDTGDALVQAATT